ncbi:hypothetical protein HRbin01_01763 [archaeon HR01]|nr:hypothetical protein HRbin01_01763 [archaeon HR01]
MKSLLTILTVTFSMVIFIMPVFAQIPILPPEIILYADRYAYHPGDRVVIIGHAVDEDFNPVPNIEILVLIVDAENNPVLDTVVSTNQSGMFSIAYTIPSNVTEGQFLVTAEESLGEFSPGVFSFLVCSLCVTEPKVVVVTTTTPGPTVTTTQTITSVATTTITTQATTFVESASYGDILTIVFIAILIALFVVMIIAVRKYG